MELKKKKKNTISREVPQQSTATDIICSQINCWCVFIHSGGVSGTPGSQSDLLTTEQLRWGRLGVKGLAQGHLCLYSPRLSWGLNQQPCDHKLASLTFRPVVAAVV